jgi:hypothetical protein
MVELKANKDGEVYNENIRQVHRQMFVMQQALTTDATIRYPQKTGNSWEWHTLDHTQLKDVEWRLVVVDPATWLIREPNGIRITLTDERTSELEEEWEQMRVFMNKPVEDIEYDIHWEDSMPPCSCGKCFPPPVFELPEECAEHASAYYEAHQDEKYAREAKRIEGDMLKHILTRLRSEQHTSIDRGSFTGYGWRVTLAKNNTLRVKPFTESMG